MIRRSRHGWWRAFRVFVCRISAQCAHLRDLRSPLRAGSQTRAQHCGLAASGSLWGSVFPALLRKGKLEPQSGRFVSQCRLGNIGRATGIENEFDSPSPGFDHSGTEKGVRNVVVEGARGVFVLSSRRCSFSMRLDRDSRRTAESSPEQWVRTGGEVRRIGESEDILDFSLPWPVQNQS